MIVLSLVEGGGAMVCVCVCVRVCVCVCVYLSSYVLLYTGPQKRIRQLCSRPILIANDSLWDVDFLII